MNSGISVSYHHYGLTKILWNAVSHDHLSVHCRKQTKTPKPIKVYTAETGTVAGKISIIEPEGSPGNRRGGRGEGGYAR